MQLKSGAALYAVVDNDKNVICFAKMPLIFTDKETAKEAAGTDYGVLRVEIGAVIENEQ